MLRLKIVVVWDTKVKIGINESYQAIKTVPIYIRRKCTNDTLVISNNLVSYYFCIIINKNLTLFVKKK